MALWSDLPGWVWVGPTPSQGPAMREYRGLVLHVAQGTYAGTVAWQRNADARVSSHFIVSEGGTIGQMVDTALAAWTQAAGNGLWISVELAGWSGQPATPAQVEACAHVYARGVRELGWPLATTDSPDRRGLGWHGMGGTAWGAHPHCPGEPVKAQRAAILERAAQLLVTEERMFTIKGSNGLYLVTGEVDYETGTPIAVPITQAAFADYQAARVRHVDVSYVNPGYYAIRKPPLPRPAGATAAQVVDEIARRLKD